VLHAEQALQLRLEALALRMLGHIPRIHGARELPGIVVESLDALVRGDLAAELGELAERNRDAPGYLPRTYDEAEASRALSTVNILGG